MNGAKSSTQTYDSSPDTIDLGHGQAQNMDSQLNDFSPGELLVNR